jgi:hypothetical protein
MSTTDRSAQLHLWLSQEEHAALLKAAKSQHLSLSAWARQTLLAKASPAPAAGGVKATRRKESALDTDEDIAKWSKEWDRTHK